MKTLTQGRNYEQLSIGRWMASKVDIGLIILTTFNFVRYTKERILKQENIMSRFATFNDHFSSKIAGN